MMVPVTRYSISAIGLLCAASSVFLLRILLFCTPAAAQTFPDSTADIVIGQTDFVSGGTGLTQTTFNSPIGVALDTTVSPQILYVSDYLNNRILGYYNYPFLQNGASADFVIGQTDFVSNTSGTTSSTFNGPVGIAVDSQGYLWVTDYTNNRILVFITPATTDYTASYFRMLCIRKGSVPKL